MLSVAKKLEKDKFNEIEKAELDIFEVFKSSKYKGFIPVNKQLLQYFDEKTAIIYADIVTKYIYWQNEGRIDSEGYFFYTGEDMQFYTGYSAPSQDKALYLLQAEGLISKKNKLAEGGKSAKPVRHIKVLLDSKAILRVFKKEQLEGVARVETVKDILDIIFQKEGSIMLNRSLLYSLGGAYVSPKNALIYMELLQRYRQFYLEDKLTDKSWFYISVEDLEKNTGYNWKAQNRAIKYLEKQGLIETYNRGRTLSENTEERKSENRRFIKIYLDHPVIEVLNEGKKLFENKADKLGKKSFDDIAKYEEKIAKNNKIVPLSADIERTRQFFKSEVDNSLNRKQTILSRKNYNYNKNKKKKNNKNKNSKVLTETTSTSNTTIEKKKKNKKIVDNFKNRKVDDEKQRQKPAEKYNKFVTDKESELIFSKELLEVFAETFNRKMKLVELKGLIEFDEDYVITAMGKVFERNGEKSMKATRADEYLSKIIIDDFKGSRKNSKDKDIDKESIRKERADFKKDEYNNMPKKEIEKKEEFKPIENTIGKDKQLYLFNTIQRNLSIEELELVENYLLDDELCLVASDTIHKLKHNNRKYTFEEIIKKLENLKP